MGELPGREQEPNGHRERRLEHHGAGHVAHRQGVLVPAYPQDAVELLGELRREWGHQERKRERRQTRRLPEVAHRVDEELGPAHHEDQTDGDLDEGRRRRALDGPRREPPHPHPKHHPQAERPDVMPLHLNSTHAAAWATFEPSPQIEIDEFKL